MKKIMAVVLNYNSFEDCIKCVGFLKQQEKVELEITIVDNCSTDDMTQELLQYGRENGVNIILNKENKGFSAGNNIGLRLASEHGCDYGLIINPDVEIRDSDYVSTAIEKLNQDGQIVVLGTDVINKKKQHQNPMREVKYWEEVLWPIVLLRNKLTKTLPYICDYEKSGYCQKLSGCCFFVRMSFMEKINYLDESVFLYSEEPILAAIVADSGYKEFYMHNLAAYHMHEDSEKGDSNQRLERLFQSRKYYLRKYSKYGKLRLAVATASINLQKKLMIAKNK